jgi:hypothetical protein
VLVVAALPACNASISQPMLQEALVGTSKNPEALSAICGRAISEFEANQAGPSLSFKNVVASRPFTGYDGKGTAEVAYKSTSGAACAGTMSFDFHQETTEKRYSRRNASYTSKFELTNVVYTRKP